MKYWKTKSTKKKKITPLPFCFYYIPVLLFAITGLADSIYLAVSHYRVHSDLGYSSFCAVSRAFNCDTVSSSPYAVFLGIPVAIWGAIGYAAVIYVIVLAGSRKAQKQRFWPLLFWLSLVFSICSLVLAGVSTFLISSYCIMCILTYLVNFGLLYYAWFINKRYGNLGLIRGGLADIAHLWNHKVITTVFFSGVLVVIFFYNMTLAEYWHARLPAIDQKLPSGITAEGHPWIGAENPELIIEEFTDYLCTQCRIKHFYLRRLIAENPGKIKLIHRHFPMDHKVNPLLSKPYHMGSGAFALLSIYATAHGKFWEANDLFFSTDPSTGVINSKKIAESLGLSPGKLHKSLHDRRILYILQADIQKGLELGMTGTPGYLIGGRFFQGYIPSGILEEILE